MKTNPAELPGVLKNKRAFQLIKHEMIVPAGRKSRGLDPQLTAHAEMKTEPGFIAEMKEHLLSAGFGAQEPLPNEPASECPDVGPAEDSFLTVQPHSAYPVAEAGVPLFPEVFDLG